MRDEWNLFNRTCSILLFLSNILFDDQLKCKRQSFQFLDVFCVYFNQISTNSAQISSIAERFLTHFFSQGAKIAAAVKSKKNRSNSYGLKERYEIDPKFSKEILQMVSVVFLPAAKVRIEAFEHRSFHKRVFLWILPQASGGRNGHPFKCIYKTCMKVRCLVSIHLFILAFLPCVLLIDWWTYTDQPHTNNVAEGTQCLLNDDWCQTANHVHIFDRSKKGRWHCST